MTDPTYGLAYADERSSLWTATTAVPPSSPDYPEPEEIIEAKDKKLINDSTTKKSLSMAQTGHLVVNEPYTSKTLAVGGHTSPTRRKMVFLWRRVKGIFCSTYQVFCYKRRLRDVPVLPFPVAYTDRLTL